MDESQVKRKEIGIVGALIIIGQALATYQSNLNVSDQFELLSKQVVTLLSDRQQLEGKSDLMKGEIKVLQKQIKELKTELQRDLSEIMECDP